MAITFIGEGGTSTGDFHEGLNMAAVWKLPLVLVIENNRYAFSTPAYMQYAAERLADRGPGYGIEAVNVDGNDPDAMAAAYARAFARAREGWGPTLIEAMIGRMRGHSEGDDSLKVVPTEEHRRYVAEDPVPGYARQLEAAGLLDAERRAGIDARIAELVAGASTPRSPPPSPGGDLAAGAPGAGAAAAAPAPPSDVRRRVTYVDAIHQALVEEMETIRQ